MQDPGGVVMVRHYSAPLAFRQALEQQLRSAPSSGFGRRQRLVFGEVFAPLSRVAGDAVEGARVCEAQFRIGRLGR